MVRLDVCPASLAAVLIATSRRRYNAARAAQAQSKIKILEKLPELEPPEDEEVVHFRMHPTEKVPPPLLQLSDVDFAYDPQKPIVKNVNVDGALKFSVLSKPD